MHRPFVLNLQLQLLLLVRQSGVRALLQLQQQVERLLVVLLLGDALLLVHLELQVLQASSERVCGLALDHLLHGLDAKNSSLLVSDLLSRLLRQLLVLLFVLLQELLKLFDLDQRFGLELFVLLLR